MKKFRKAQEVEIPKIDQVLNSTPKESKTFISKSLEIADQIAFYLEERDLSQKKLADALDKSEAEISKWLTGNHNFTIRTITAIETALECEIIVTPNRVKNNLFHYSAQVFRATINERNPSSSNEESYTVKTKASKQFSLQETA